jgi:hypothetical protein
MTDSPVPPAAAPGPAGPKQALSLTSFILGIAGLVFSWVPVLPFLASLAAIIIGFIARKNEPGAPKWMALVGIILGFVAIGLAILFLVIAALAIAAGGLGTVTTN